MQKLKGWMGTDHTSFRDMASNLGLGKDALVDHTTNRMSRSSLPSDQHQRRLLDDAQKLEEENKQLAKAKAKAKAAGRVKKFDVEAKRSILELEVKEAGGKLANKALDMLSKADKTLQQTRQFTRCHLAPRF